MISADSPFYGVPSQISDLSNSLVDFVERAVGIRPDYSPDTLSIVDHFSQLAHAELSDRPEVSDLTAQALGAYFGEVLRRSEGAFWQVPNANFHNWSLCGVSSFVMINPIGVGYDALYATTGHQGPSSQLKLAPEDRQMVNARLASLPPTRDTEYFTLCTRLEVIQITMECVLGEQNKRGYDDMVFTADDYSNELRPLGEL